MEWRDVKGYEGLYQVSNTGQVRSLDRIVFQRHKDGGQARHIYKGKILKLSLQKNGYLTVDLHTGGNFHRMLVHRLVGEAFLMKPDGKDYINHKDSDTTNNNADNLEWCTQSENIKFAYDNGRKHPPHERKVGQFDDSGNLIKVWNSQTEASKALNTHQSNIYKACVGLRNKAGGFAWSYIE